MESSPASALYRRARDEQPAYAGRYRARRAAAEPRTGSVVAVAIALCLGPVACSRIGFDPPSGSPGGDPAGGDIADGDFASGDWFGGDTVPSSGGDTGPPALVQAQAVGVEWGTPTSILWSWTMTGVAGDLASLEFVTAESFTDLIARSGTVRVTQYDRAAIPFPDTFDLSLMTGILSLDLPVDTPHFAQLSATDTSGLVSTSAIQTGRTAVVPPREVVIFADAQTPGYSIPSDFVRSTVAPYAGTHHYMWDVNCASQTCFQWLRRQEVDGVLTAIDQTGFDTTAYFEFVAASNSATPSTWSSARLWFGTPGNTAGLLFEFSGWGMRLGGAYQLYQFPLRAFTNMDDGTPLTLADVIRGLYEVAIGGEWGVGSTVYIDEIRIRW